MYTFTNRNTPPASAETPLGKARPAHVKVQGSGPGSLWQGLATRVQLKPAFSRQAGPRGHEAVAETGSKPAGPPADDIAKTGLQGQGESLPFRAPLEQSFGVDLGSVRLHAGPQAQTACDRLGAEAYALNDRIALRAAPSFWLLAHEVAHIVQQRGRAGAKGAADANSEADADRAATEASAGWPASVHASASSGVPQCFRFTADSQKAYPKAAAYLLDEMPKVGNDARLLKALTEGARTTEDKVRAGFPWGAGPLVTPKMLRGTRAGVFHTHQGSQEVEIHQGELDKWEKETDPGLIDAYAFWLETVVLHEYVHYLGDDREKDKDEEWGQDFEEKAYGNRPATRDAAFNLEIFLRARFHDGDYEVKVTGKEAAFKQRFRVTGADVGNGDYDGVVGNTVKVSKSFDLKGRWEIFVEHDDGKSGWQPSKIRKIVTDEGWLIRTEDWTDRDFNDLEISVKRTAMAKPPATRKTRS
ncbi:MAG: eCIS core domain-containing protein [Candidatus Binatia bacterium]